MRDIDDLKKWVHAKNSEIERDAYPLYWEFNQAFVVQEFLIMPGSPEYKHVEDIFLQRNRRLLSVNGEIDHGPKDFKIQQITRIQNATLMKQYQQQYLNLCNRRKKDVRREVLIHE